MVIGEIDGVSVGATFESRRALHDAGVHRPLQAGIAGGADAGAQSIVLSGGYVDDEDYGDVIIYTGHGGRDPATGRQVANQNFTRQNQALVKSHLEGLPVRVIRGAEHQGPHSPDRGYRYEGLFSVDRFWKELGVDGFQVCRFRLVKGDPLRGDYPTTETKGSGEAPKRIETTVLRVVRDTKVGKQMKRMYDYRCQVCGERLECEGGPYAEAAHIRPLGRPHNGPDVLDNLLCLCPNHHVLFDNGALTVEDDFKLSDSESCLTVRTDHAISHAHLEYHRGMWGRGG